MAQINDCGGIKLFNPKNTKKGKTPTKTTKPAKNTPKK